MSRWLQQQWSRVTPWHVLLWPLSLLFEAVAAARKWAYRQGFFNVWRAPVPVIVVGNISVGGTGKTPLVLWLAEFLRSQGFRPGIVSRGYRGKVLSPYEVRDDDDPKLVGDEPLLLARRAGCPVWIGLRRPYVARAMLESHPECNVIISDDGLQHYALARDMEIAVVDGVRRFGNRMLLPAGPLREPISRFREIDAVVVNGGVPSNDEFGMRLLVSAFRNVQDPAIIGDAGRFVGESVHAVAGIGNPGRFFEQLTGMGFKVMPHDYPDHHLYIPADFAFDDNRAIVMTEKDAVKCTGFAQPNWWYLEVEVRMDDGFGRRVLQQLRK